MPARIRFKRSRDKVPAHRRRLVQMGLQSAQVRVPDMHSPAFVVAAHRQSLAVRDSSQAGADQDFIDAIADWGRTRG